MIRPQLQTAPGAPATLVSLARVGIAGLSMASLLPADDAASTLAPATTTPVSTELTAPRVRAAV